MVSPMIVVKGGKYAWDQTIGRRKKKNNPTSEKHKQSGDDPIYITSKGQKRRVRGDDDPKYEIVKRRSPTTGRMEKVAVKRNIPAYIPVHDAEILKDARSLAYHYDLGLSFGPFQLGVESALGWIPGVGDFIGLFMATTVFLQCCRVDAGLPFGKKFHMVFNIVVDVLFGIVPLLGDFFDMFWKANTKNVLILDEHLRDVYYKEGSDFKRQSAGLYSPGDPDGWMESLQEKDLEPVSHKWYKAGGPPKGRSERTATSRQDMPQHAPASRWEEPRHAPHPSEKPLPQRPIPSHPRGQAPTPRGYLGWGKKQRTVDPEMGEMSEMRGGPPMVAARA